MVIGILQPFNAFFRPHATAAGEVKTTTRRLWEILHKGGGYTAIFLGILNIFGGAQLLPDLLPTDGNEMASQFLSLEAAALAITTGLAIYLAGTRSGTSYAKMIFEDPDFVPVTNPYKSKDRTTTFDNPAVGNPGAEATLRNSRTEVKEQGTV